MANITDKLRQHVLENEHIQVVHFDAIGNHHFNVHELNGEKYTRLTPDLNGNLTTEQSSEPFLITETLSREDVLGNTKDAAQSAVDTLGEASDTNPQTQGSDQGIPG